MDVWCVLRQECAHRDILRTLRHIFWIQVVIKEVSMRSMPPAERIQAKQEAEVRLSATVACWAKIYLRWDISSSLL